jgi:hypothetical protein
MAPNEAEILFFFFVSEPYLLIIHWGILIDPQLRHENTWIAARLFFDLVSITFPQFGKFGKWKRDNKFAGNATAQHELE